MEQMHNKMIKATANQNYEDTVGDAELTPQAELPQAELLQAELPQTESPQAESPPQTDNQEFGVKKAAMELVRFPNFTTLWIWHDL